MVGGREELLGIGLACIRLCGDVEGLEERVICNEFEKFVFAIINYICYSVLLLLLDV